MGVFGTTRSIQSAAIQAGVAVVLSSMAAQNSYAANTARDLIVRLKEGRQSRISALKAFSHSGATANVQVLNEREGVLKLQFSSAGDLQRAQQALELSGEVANIAPNYLYQPALRLTVREVAAKPQFLFAPLPSLVDVVTSESPRIPDVLQPPAQDSGADMLEPSDWAMKSIRMPAEVAGERHPVISAVIDTGVDYNHEDLIAGMWRDPSNSAEVGYDFVHNHNKPYDVRHFDIEGCLKDVGCQLGFGAAKFLTNPGHGTHCAGHVGAVANNKLGIRGAGLGTKMIGLKFFYDNGEEYEGQGDDAAAIKSIDYAIKKGAKVISASWGGRMTKAEADKSELKAAIIRAQKAGVLFVAAAGNDGINQDRDREPVYPAAYEMDNLVVVAAINDKDELADFSNYGAKSVHIAAPGVKVLSTTVGSQYSDIVAKFKDKKGVEHEIAWDGTSMATPIVAGAAALLWSKNPGATYHEIKDKLLKSARPVSGLAGKIVTGGALDVTAALSR